LFGTVTGKRLAVLGFAFKADTNDTREAPAIRICKDLLEEGAQLAIYDPKVLEGQMHLDLACFPVEIFKEGSLNGEGVWYKADSPAEAVTQADAVLILTEWSIFAALDWKELAPLMRKPGWLFDTRSVANLAMARAAGLNVWCVGSGS